MSDRECERAGGEAADRASLDENTAGRRERREEPAPQSDHVIRDADDNPTFGGAAGTTVGGPADDLPPDPYGT